MFFHNLYHYILSTLFTAFKTILFGIVAVFCISDCDLYLRFCPYNEKNAFKDKIIWIAGASSGIGACLAQDLTKAGAQVIISARRENLLREVAENSAKYGLKPTVVQMDITDECSRQVAFDEIIKKYGRIDSVVLNAGRGQRGLAAETTSKMADELMQLNFLSFVALTRIILQSMIVQKSGQIIVISSVAGKVGTPISAAYSASKYALHGYFDAVRAEVSVHNIQIGIVCPGPTESEFALTRIETGNHSRTKETKKMPTERCTYLIAKGMHNKLDEMWISQHPVLFSVYLNVYAPWLSRQVFKYLIGPSRVKIMSSGGDPYDIMKILGLKK